MAQPAVLLDDVVIKRQIVTNLVATTYTLQALDDNYWLRTLSGDPVTITVPAQLDVDFEPYTLVTIERAGAGVVTIQADGGVILHTSTNLTMETEFSVVQLKRVGPDEWTVVNVSIDPPRIVPCDYFWAQSYFTGGEVLFRADIRQEFKVAANFDGWVALLVVAPSAATVFTFKVDGATLGTLSFAIGSNTGVFGTSSQTDLNGHLFEIYAPNPADSSAAGLSITMQGI